MPSKMSAQEQVRQLSEAFPSLTLSSIKEALDSCENDADSAAVLLLSRSQSHPPSPLPPPSRNHEGRILEPSPPPPSHIPPQNSLPSNNTRRPGNKTRKGVDRKQALETMNKQFPSADVSFIRDILWECGWDTQKAAATLQAMQLPESSGTVPRTTVGTEAAQQPSHSSCKNGPCSFGDGNAVASGGREASGKQPWALQGHRLTLGSQSCDSSSLAEECALGQLSSRFEWADVALLRDVLQACQGDASSAATWLDSVTNGEDAGLVLGITGEMGAPKVDNSYRTARAEAIKASRTQRRYAKGASRAFEAGDHSTASRMSRLSREEQARAQELHARAAAQILEWKNPNYRWRLDLHGLHVREALDALSTRLRELESPGHLPTERVGRASQQTLLGGEGVVGGCQGDGTPLAAPRVESQSVGELEVITGVGNHSVGGASLPAAVQSFLVQQEYSFRIHHAGVLLVKPKLKHS